ncbi:MAG: prolipoprotein diacylglyceryl transferase [Anaerolineales bacterium]|nr:MAG: prolipoprotein diacylglyceryl transferase [Anaerolineales bacterium]
MLPILQVGPFALQLPGLLLIIGVWLGSLLTEREAARRQLSPSRMSNLIFLALIGGLIGARLGYVLRYLDLYLQSPLGILALNPNTLAPFEGLVAAIIVAVIYAQRSKMAFWATLEVLTPGIALFMIFVGLAHLTSGDAFGLESDLAWSIELWGARRHPTQIYEVLAASLVFIMILRIRLEQPFDGFLFLIYIGLAALQRFLLEALRGDSLIILGTVRGAQLLSLLVIMASLIGLHFNARRAEGIKRTR